MTTDLSFKTIQVTQWGQVFKILTEHTESRIPSPARCQRVLQTSEASPASAENAEGSPSGTRESIPGETRICPDAQTSARSSDYVGELWSGIARQANNFRRSRDLRFFLTVNVMVAGGVATRQEDCFRVGNEMWEIFSNASVQETFSTTKPEFSPGNVPRRDPPRNGPLGGQP